MIDDLFRRHLQNYARDAKLSDMLSSLLLELTLKKLLSMILSSNQEIELIANRSYHHINGFAKIVLCENGVFGQKLRLHIWPGKNNHSEINIHNHAWDYSSVVCIGALNMRVFVETDHGDLEYTKFKVGNLGNQGVESFGRTYLSCVLDQVIQKREIYSLTHDKLHQIFIETYSATLVMQGSHSTDFSYIYLKKGEIISPYFVNKMKPRSLRILLEKVLSEL